MREKKKLRLKDLKVQSFITDDHQKHLQGGFTGNCLSFINITCPDPNCDFKSVPLNECSDDCPGNTFDVPICSGNCTEIQLGCDPAVR